MKAGKISTAPNVIRAAIYTRKSCVDRSDKVMTSCEAQRKICEEYAQEQGWEVLETQYDDYGYSGKNTNRPALKQLWADMRKRKIDRVIVYKPDRITRSPQDFANMYQTYFEPYGIQLQPVEGQLEMGNANGRFSANVILAAAQFERELASERIKSKRQISIQNGYWPGGRPPLGYRNENKQLVLDEARASKVREIFEKYVGGTSLRKLTQDPAYRDLKDGRVRKEGIHPAYEKMTYIDLRNMIKNPIYKGYLKSEKGLMKGIHEPIVSEALWEQANAKRTSSPSYQGERRAVRQTLLSRKLRCEECDLSICAFSHTNKKGILHAYYVCSSKTHCQQCKGINALIYEAHLDRLVTQEVRKVLNQCEEIPELNTFCQNHTKSRAQALAKFQLFDRKWASLIQEEQRSIVRNMIKKIYISKTTVRIQFTTAFMNRILKDLVTTPEFELIEEDVVFERIIHETLALPRSRNINSGETKKIPLTKRATKTVKNAYIQAMEWKKKIDSGLRVSELKQLYDASSWMIRSYLNFFLLSPAVQKAILRNELDPQFTIIDITTGRFPLDFDEQEAFFKIK